MQDLGFGMEKDEFLVDVYLKLAEAEKQDAESKTIDTFESLEKIKNKYL